MQVFLQIIVACSLQADGSGCLIEGGCLMQGRYNYTVLTACIPQNYCAV